MLSNSFVLKTTRLKLNVQKSPNNYLLYYETEAMVCLLQGFHSCLLELPLSCPFPKPFFWFSFSIYLLLLYTLFHPPKNKKNKKFNEIPSLGKIILTLTTLQWVVQILYCPSLSLCQPLPTFSRALRWWRIQKRKYMRTAHSVKRLSRFRNPYLLLTLIMSLSHVAKTCRMLVVSIMINGYTL